MGRGIVLLLTMLLCFVAGGLCLAYNAQRVHLERLSELHLLSLCGSVLFLLGGTAGLMAMFRLRRDCRRVAESLQAAATRPGIPLLAHTDNRELLPLITLINEVLDAAGRCTSEAAVRVKELDIQLRVALAERQHAEAIIYSISDAVLVTDPFDELVLANESAARTFEFDPARYSRLPVDQILHDSTMVGLMREMRQSNSRTGRRIVEHTLKVGGGERTFKITLSTVTDQDEGPAGVVAVMHDITREKEISNIKNDFVSNVSHELRTPLASIKAYVEMLIDGEANDEKTKREFYDVIQNEANRLSRLIDNILNISRIESGVVKINKQPQSLPGILKEAIEVITPQARSKQIEVVDQLTPVFYQVMADKDMLYQAVLNLLSNSVKYTPERGTITVQTIVDEDARKVITRISDTGVGIPTKDLPFVFDKFYRVDANKHMAKGTGLGLSLVKHIIESVHHGRIFVDSHVGKGTTFGFELELSQ